MPGMHPTPRAILPILLSPAVLVFVIAALIVAGVTLHAGGDPLVLARLGTRFSQGDPSGTEGYDGQFVYYIAIHPDPALVAPFLDVPAYRYQRILLPVLAHLLSFGNPSAVPWVLVIIEILALAAGTWIVGALLSGWGASRWYALVYGLYAGYLLAVLVDLPEPLAYGLVAGGIAALESRHNVLGWFLLGLSVFAKEVTILFVGAAIFAYLAQKRPREAFWLALIGILPYLVFQVWLWKVFGQPGIGSGGAMATQFEWIPYMGLWRIGQFSLVYLAAMSIVFVPAVVLPSLWGIWKSVRTWFLGEKNLIVSGLFLNSLIIAFTPFSTFRETGGILRLACGLVLAVVLFAGRYQQKRVLNYSLLWLVLILFVIKSF